MLKLILIVLFSVFTSGVTANTANTKTSLIAQAVLDGLGYFKEEKSVDCHSSVLLLIDQAQWFATNST